MIVKRKSDKDQSYGRAGLKLNGPGLGSEEPLVDVIGRTRSENIGC